MQVRGEQLFAHARFTKQQHRRIRRRHEIELFDHLAQRPASPDHRFALQSRRQIGSQQIVGEPGHRVGIAVS